MKNRQQPYEVHAVIFYSPGTLFAEVSERRIDRWDPRLACKMAEKIVERHGARPYAFRFVTRLTAGPVEDGRGGVLEIQPKEIARSGSYFLGGKLVTLAEVEARDGASSILAGNMRNNQWAQIVESTTGYGWAAPFEREDHLVDPKTGQVSDIP